MSPPRRPASRAAATSHDELDHAVELVDGEHRPILVDVGDQLDLAHHELVEALLATATPGDDGTTREAAVDDFAGLLRRHVQTTNHVLLPWVRRVGGDDGERVAERAETIQAAADRLADELHRNSGGVSSDRPLHALADELHRSRRTLRRG